MPLEIKIQRNELWVVCVSLRPSGADIQHLLCGISFVLIRLHCTAGQPELRAGVGAGVAAGPHRVALLPPLRRGPGRLLPGRDVRRAGGVSAPHQDLQPPPLPGGEPRRRSKYITSHPKNNVTARRHMDYIRQKSPIFWLSNTKNSCLI